MKRLKLNTKPTARCKRNDRHSTIDSLPIKQKKQTILTSEKHTEYTTMGQRVSRHSLPTLLYLLFFPTTLFFNSILASRTSGTFGFAPTHKASPSAKPKEPLFSQRTANNDVSYLKYQIYPDNYSIKYNF